MIPEIGHFALVLVLVLSALGFVGVFQFSQKFGLHELVAPSVVGQFVFATIAFVCLAFSHFSQMTSASITSLAIPTRYYLGITRLVLLGRS